MHGAILMEANIRAIEFKELSFEVSAGKLFFENFTLCDLFCKISNYADFDPIWHGLSCYGSHWSDF